MAEWCLPGKQQSRQCSDQAQHGDACMAQFEGWAGFQGGKFWKEIKQFSSAGLAGNLQH